MKAEKGEREKERGVEVDGGRERGRGKEEARGDPWLLGSSSRERPREGKRGENKLKAKLYSHKKMELFLDAVPPRYEEKEG